MADPEFRYRYNDKITRWEVLQRHSDGTEKVIQAYVLPKEAREHVERANKQPPESSVET
jgi:hypothetical protein